MEDVMRTLAEEWRRLAGLESVYEGESSGPVVMDVVIVRPRGWGSRDKWSVIIEDRVAGERVELPYTTSAA